MDERIHNGDRDDRELRRALNEAEGLGDVLCFLELAVAGEHGDMLLTHYARRGLAGMLGDCSTRVDRVCRILDRVATRRGDAASPSGPGRRSVATGTAQ